LAKSMKINRKDAVETSKEACQICVVDVDKI